MKKVVLSICMMIRNEEKNLRRCLDSLQPLREAISSELIIVDTGSEDSSVEIAKEYTDKVYFHPWNDDFSAMRNITIGYAIGEWVLIIDADEQLFKDDALIGFLRKAHNKNIAGVMISCINITNEREKTSPMLPTVRLFKRTKDFYYTGIIHNQPHLKGEIVKVDAALKHYGYILDDKDLMERKFQRTSKLLKKVLEKDPDHVYYRFQLAVSYSMHKDHIAALLEMKRACELQKRQGGFKKEHSYLLGSLVQFYNACEDFCDEMIDAAKLCLELEPTYIDVWYFLAQAHLFHDELAEAYQCYEQYVSLLDKIDDLEISHNISVNLYTLGDGMRARYNMMAICKKDENWGLFEKHVDEIFSFEMTYDIAEIVYFLLFQVDFCRGLFDGHRDKYRKLFSYKAELIAKVIQQAEKFWVDASNINRRLYSNMMSEIRGDLYGKLNKARNNREYLMDFAEEFFQEDVEKYPHYFSIALLALMEDRNLCDRCGYKLSEQTIIEYMKHLDDVNKEEFLQMGKRFLRKNFHNEKESFDRLRLQKNIAKYLLFSGELCEMEYIEIFKLYINIGSRFIEHLYNKRIILEQRCSDMKNIEEIFLLYINLAGRVSLEERIDYLNKAKNVFPEMRKGIRVLLEEMLEKTPEQIVRENEMERLKKTLLIHIRKLIDEDKFYEALQVVEEAERVLGKDLEILSLKSEIAVKNS